MYTKSGLVSVIVPVYNAAPYLKDTIESVQKQTYKNWELILVDDVSTDESMEILKRYQSNRVRVFSLSEHRGPAAARNVGSANAQGKYLAFLDADDVWDKDKLKIQVEFMQNSQCAFSFTAYEYADENARRNGKIVSIPKQITYEKALKNTTISTITVMFDRTKLNPELLVMPEDCQREDTATWWKILRNGYVAYGINEPLSIYRRHAGSYSSNKWRAVKGTWKMYREQESFSVLKTTYYMMFNLYNAVKRRI